MPPNTVIGHVCPKIAQIMHMVSLFILNPHCLRLEAVRQIVLLGKDTCPLIILIIPFDIFQ